MTATSRTRSADLLRPYVSGLALAWPGRISVPGFLALDGTLAFVDISGFTRLTELLSAKGKAGAEELTTLLNATFVGLLAIARERDAELVKWGGDAVLLFYSGEGHAARAVEASWRMQQAMRTLGRLRTSVGQCRLRMSVGIHSGTFHFWLVGDSHQELMVTGPAASVTAVMEGTAEAGEIVVSNASAQGLAPRVLGQAKGDGALVTAAPAVVPAPRRPAEVSGDPAAYLSAALREHLLEGEVDSEHRQVAVAFIDFTGVDELLEVQGPEAVAAQLHQAISRTQESCEKHHVTFWETDIGVDGGKIMLVAGAPASHDEDDAGRLLAVVSEILRDGGGLPLRAGVNSGRVFAGDFGPPYRRTYSVKGDAVNLAARLMAKAGWGQAYVSTAVLERSHIRFDSEALEPFLVKGKSAPVQAHRLGRPTSAASQRTRDLAPLVGRDTEMEDLKEALRSAADRHGACIELCGPPGIGKSRLVAEAKAIASGLRLLEARCDDYHSGTPYAPMRDLLRQCLDIGLDASPADAGKILEERVRIHAPALAPWLPLLATVADATVAPTVESEVLDERFRRSRLESACRELLTRVLTEPTLIVIDDTQAMDDASASLMRELVAEVGARPWVLLLTRRPAPGGLILPEDDAVTQLALPPLSPDAVTKLLHAMTEAHPLPQHREALVGERSGGNPLFLLELLATPADAANAEALPDSVEGVLAAQIDRLPPSQRRLLRAASVLGMEFSVPVLSEMLAEPVSIRGMEHFLIAEGTGQLRFRHALLRDTAYEGLPFSRRRELHAAAGHVLERKAGDAAAPLLAVHFGQAGESFPAFCYARLAAERASTAYATVEAATLFAQALQAGRACPDVPRELLVEVAEPLGDARAHLGEFATAEAAYRTAKGLATTPMARARLGLKMAQVAHRTGSYRTGLRRLTIAEKALEGLADHEALRLRAEVKSEYAVIRHKQGRNNDAVTLLQSAVELAERSGDTPVLASALEHLDFFEFQCGIPSGGEHARRALDLLGRGGDYPFLECRGHNSLGIRAEVGGRWTEAVEEYRQARDQAQRAGDPWAVAVMSNNIAGILADQGHLDEAEAAAEETLRTFRAAETAEWIADANIILGRVAARRRQFNEADARLTAARSGYASVGRAARVAHADGLVAERHLLAGDPAAALRLALDALGSLHSSGAAGSVDESMGSPLLNRIAGLASAALGDPGGARSYVIASAEAARRWDARYQLALALQAEADLWPAEFPDAQQEADALFDQMDVLHSARRLPV